MYVSNLLHLVRHDNLLLSFMLDVSECLSLPYCEKFHGIACEVCSFNGVWLKLKKHWNLSSNKICCCCSRLNNPVVIIADCTWVQERLIVFWRWIPLQEKYWVPLGYTINYFGDGNQICLLCVIWEICQKLILGEYIRRHIRNIVKILE